ncbi:hypothetical protein Lpp221_09241 [Lacticaseibacillus paracasei subsp. paracasei Lpp221]|uniref:Uncharacterized protein n=1 Tax=Lacticaseibacillus paracasei subsp. paracasei Lpp126 TaxID=1256206 RepID=S2QWJ0_LACPA|nr:hypothetical protein Lpp126_18367 [Lacticaseibacillus paracasei subsp. paracasei Lpp126]EPC78745.1 hypothetical protein Lpp221_09241 [Lacticaseibacillus paracasei subsp. paracasei Lpp221]
MLAEILFLWKFMRIEKAERVATMFELNLLAKGNS